MPLLKGTAGHRLVPELENLAERLGAEKVEKEAFGSLALAGKLEKVRDTIESVELVGLCTDICVVSNALIIKAALPKCPSLSTVTAALGLRLIPMGRLWRRCGAHK